MKRPARWTDRLPEPIVTKSGTRIETRKHAADYMLTLSERRSSSYPWQAAARLLLEGAPIAQVADKVKVALFVDGQLTFTPAQKATRPARR